MIIYPKHPRTIRRDLSGGRHPRAGGVDPELRERRPRGSAGGAAGAGEGRGSENRPGLNRSGDHGQAEAAKIFVKGQAGNVVEQRRDHDVSQKSRGGSATTGGPRPDRKDAP